MEQHALALLREAEKWEWQKTSRIQASGLPGGNTGKYSAITPRLLACAINESCKLGGTMLRQFWDKLGECHPQLKINVAELKREATAVPPETAPAILMNGIQREDVDFNPVLQMAAEVFTHLGVAFMNPGGTKSGSGTPCSVGDIEKMETNELLQVLATDEKFGIRKQAALKHLATRRDGQFCPITEFAFSDVDPFCAYPILSRIIPNSFHGKPDTLRLISMFAGSTVTEIVTQKLNSIGNAMNLQADAHKIFDNLGWGIEAKTVDRKITYIYRQVVARPPAAEGNNQRRANPVTKKDGEEIMFGQGVDGNKLGGGPSPLLCNLHLAVARVVQMSGAADAIKLLMEEADDSDFPHLYVGSEETYDILQAKLLLVS